MKKYINYGFACMVVCIFSLIGFSFGYHQQGFSQYQEGLDGISFNCVDQCFIILGQKDKIDYFSLDGMVNGNGVIGYGFLIGDQISLLNQYNVVLQSQINESMNFLNYKQYFSSIPGDTDLILLIDGNIKGNLKVDVIKFSFKQKIGQGWKSFRTLDSFKPYTINLLYGPIVNGTNFNKGFYFLFIILFLVLLILKKGRQTKLKILTVGLLVLWCIYDIRMGREGINYYHNDYKNYISQNRYEKIYRDRGDFYSFVDFVQDKLNENGVDKYECIGFFTDNTRPFPGSMKYFLYPYRILINEDIGKYIIAYQSSNVEIINDDKILINKEEINGSLIKFSDYSFIFIKNN